MKYFFIHIERKFVKVDIDSIQYAISLDHHTRIVTNDCTYVPHLSLIQLETALPKDQFTRVNRGALVALNHVIAFDKDDIYLKGIRFSFSDKYRKEFEKKVQILLHQEKRHSKPKNGSVEINKNLFVDETWFMNERKQSFFPGTFNIPHSLNPTNTGLSLLH